MGRSISVHGGTLGAGGWLWYVGGVLVLAGALNVVRMEWATGLGSFAIGLVCLVPPILRWRQSLEIFEDGFVWTRLLGTVSKRRGEVRATKLILHRSRSGAWTEVLVTMADGSELSMVGLDNAEQAANLIAQLAHAAPVASAPTAGGWQPPASGGAA